MEYLFGLVHKFTDYLMSYDTFQVVPTWYKDQLDHYPGHVHHGPELPGHGHHGPELIYTSPPKGHPSEYLHGAPPPSSLQHYPSDWESSGPGLGSE